MGQVINTNTLSLLTQNNLSKSQSALNTSIQRLSSGMRINSAKDDAAGQAIANRFTANIRGLTQAQRNANDGISLAQTTEGALNEVNNNLQRIRELAVQAANGSNSDADKASIQAEITQRLSEIDRTSAQTDFNGVKVLSSTAGSLTIQVGSQDSETVSIGLSEISSSTLNLTGLKVDGTDSITQVAATQTMGGLTLTSTETVTGGNFNVAMVQGGSGSATVASFSGSTLTITGDFAAAPLTYTAIGTALASVSANITVTGAADGSTALVTDDLAISTDGVDGFTGTNTASPLAAIDAALATVDEKRGSLGAVQNRFDSIISNLGTTINNLTSSRSRIEDADYATEVSNMTRAQILQQAGTSVLAKANQSTQGVMALLQ
jgi:flagellin